MNTSFRTALSPVSAPFQIGHNDQLLLIGSCFTEHIGQRLVAHKFRTLTNPYGIVYNPFSIVQCLDRLCAGNQPFEAADLFENAGLWHSWEHHGCFSKPGKKETLEGINSAYLEAVEVLKETEILMLTFGTAEVFTLRQTGQVVANNHKMPGTLLDQRRLSVSEIVEKTLEVLERLAQLRDAVPVKVILTVSPVRHLRNGLVENQRSKAALILACEEICRHQSSVYYFPAYELLLDDLRDYRFYAADMVHPSPVAVDYVWQFFSDTFFTEPTSRLNDRIGKILAAVHHRPFNPQTAQHQAFLRQQLDLIRSLKQEYPRLDFGEEESFFQTSISQ